MLADEDVIHILTAIDTSNYKRNTSRMNKGWSAHTDYHTSMLTVSRSLKRELVRAQEEIKRIQSVPLVIGQFMEAIDQKYEHTMGK